LEGTVRPFISWGRSKKGKIRRNVGCAFGTERRRARSKAPPADGLREVNGIIGAVLWGGDLVITGKAEEVQQAQKTRGKNGAEIRKGGLGQKGFGRRTVSLGL